MVIVGGVFVLVAGVGLWAQMQYALHGVRASALIVDAAGVSRSRSVTAQVEVALPGERPIHTEIEDSLGGQHWTPGGRTPVVCTHIHADHMTCIADLWFDRYALVLAALMAGCSALWAGLRRRS
jgi:glyoxylase-like metal-dependent hydrolase (beta-lactamase superfamily II)